MQVKSKNNDHVCSTALTFVGSLGRRPCGLVFKQLPRDPANVNALTVMYDLYIKHLIFESCNLRDDPIAVMD